MVSSGVETPHAALKTGSLPRSSSIVRVLAFAAAGMLLTGIGFGVIPAWRSTNVNLIEVLKSANRGVQSGNTGARALIVFQMALTLALVAGTGLFVSSLERLRAAPLGYPVDNVVEAQLFPIPDGYKNLAAAAYYRDLLKKAEELPGVESACLSNFAPLFSIRYAQAVRFTNDSTGAGVAAQAYWASDNFLHTMRIPLIAGRDFGRRDSLMEPHTAIVSQSLSKCLSPDGDIIGRHVRLGAVMEDQDLEVIGIAADARLSSARADPTALYINLWQYSYSAKYGVLIMREQKAIDGFDGEVEKMVRDEGREYVQYIRTLNTSSITRCCRRDCSHGYRLLLERWRWCSPPPAYTDSWRITSRAAQERSASEWRSARLAAEFSDSFSAMRFGWRSWAARQDYCWRSRPFEPAYFVIAVAVLLLISGAAAWIPARRASRIDPITALRHE